MPTKLSNKYHDEIEQNGFIVVRNFLLPQEIEKYTKASEALVQYARDVIGPMLEPEASNSHHGPKFQSRYLGCFRVITS